MKMAGPWEDDSLVGWTVFWRWHIFWRWYMGWKWNSFCNWIEEDVRFQLENPLLGMDHALMLKRALKTNKIMSMISKIK